LDPEKELWATIAAFEKRSEEKLGKLQQVPACAFPARFRFLQQQLRLGLPEPKCDRFAEFLERFHGADSISLIFSTAYPNNPASMFGHTFLRINSREEPGHPKQDLLDYGLNYAAQVPDDENNFAFIWFGLTGGYVGEFSSLPYYAKVAEYNHSESRDLWEYNLNLSPAETWWALANAWEVETNSFAKYFFFDESCSYEILTLLEVAKPDWNITDYIYQMIPAETVKKVARIPGAIRSIKFRPSLYRKLIAYGARLSGEERERFWEVVEGRGIEQATVATLDTGAQYFFYLKQKNEGKLPPEQAGIFQKVLTERAKRGQPPAAEPVYDESSRPDWGHHASRVSFGIGSERGISDYGWFQEIGFRFAYHDLLNHDVGFVPFSEISFPGFLLRYTDADHRPHLERVDFLTIQSLAPSSWLKNPLAWRASLSYLVPADRCPFCHVLHGDGGIGFSQPIAGDRWRTYELAGLYAEFGSALPYSWRAGPRLTLGLGGNIGPIWKQQLEAVLQEDLRREVKRNVMVSAFWGQSFFLSQEWEARLSGKLTHSTTSDAKSRGEAETQLLYYF
jgi:Domain of unknown function (DUF4105)